MSNQVEEALNSARRRKMPGVTRVLQRAVEEAETMRGPGAQKEHHVGYKWHGLTPRVRAMLVSGPRPEQRDLEKLVRKIEGPPKAP